MFIVSTDAKTNWFNEVRRNNTILVSFWFKICRKSLGKYFLQNKYIPNLAESPERQVLNPPPWKEKICFSLKMLSKPPWPNTEHCSACLYIFPGATDDPRQNSLLWALPSGVSASYRCWLGLLILKPLNGGGGVILLHNERAGEG